MKVRPVKGRKARTKDMAVISLLIEKGNTIISHLGDGSTKSTVLSNMD